MRHSIAGHLNLMRLHTAGFEGLVFVLGPLLAGWRGPLTGFALLWSLGVLVNGYIFALNDLVDLPADRVDPARARSPLVEGSVSTRAALTYSVVLPLLATAIVVGADWPVSAEVPFVLMLALGAFVNVYQKATRWPLVMDLLFATTMAAPLPVATQAVLGEVPGLVWSATALLFLSSLQLNSIAGNLKDLGSDQRTGFRTVAVSLGARLRPDGTLVPGGGYVRYCWVLSGAVAAAGLLTLGLAGRGRAEAFIAAMALAGVVCWWGGRSLHRLLAGQRPPSPRGREPYFAAGFALLLGAAALSSPGPLFVIALGVLAFWEGSFALYWRWHWSMRRTRGLAG